jgi:hypothetical protein
MFSTVHGIGTYHKSIGRHREKKSSKKDNKEAKKTALAIHSERTSADS